MRPGTGMGFNAAAGGAARPGTGMRPGTGQQMRMPTGMQSGFAAGIAPTITERPLTSQGMSGVRPLTSGQGRMVQDPSYWVGLLRGRINDITTEIARMRADGEKAIKDAAVLLTYEKKYEELIKDVRSLEGDLADFNLAMDKSRTSMDASEISYFHGQLKRRNEATSRDIDALFMERAEREKGVHRLEEQITDLQRQAEARINSLSPPLLAEYKALTAECKTLNGTISALQQELERINASVEASEMALKRDRNRDEYALLEKRLALLKRERVALDEEMSSNRLDPADARERLLAKVKDDNARILALDKELKALEEDLAAKKKISADLSADIDERKNDSGEREKYELLFKRDQEMTEFIDRFNETKEKELAEQRKLQNTITALLEHISEGLEREKSMPTRQQAEEMKEDLSDKNRELKTSQMTAERLQEELTLRQTELNKIATLDVKIGDELKTLQAKMTQMRDEKRRLQDIDGLKKAAQQAKEALGVKLREYTRRRDLMRQQVQMLATEVEKRKAMLAKEPQAAALEALENKLKLQEQTVFGLREFIATKGRESDYDGPKAESLRLVGDVNIAIQKAQLLGPGLMASAGMGMGRM